MPAAVLTDAERERFGPLPKAEYQHLDAHPRLLASQRGSVPLFEALDLVPKTFEPIWLAR